MELPRTAPLPPSCPRATTQAWRRRDLLSLPCPCAPRQSTFFSHHCRFTPPGFQGQRLSPGRWPFLSPETVLFARPHTWLSGSEHVISRPTGGEKGVERQPSEL